MEKRRHKEREGSPFSAFHHPDHVSPGKMYITRVPALLSRTHADRRVPRTHRALVNFGANRISCILNAMPSSSRAPLILSVLCIARCLDGVGRGVFSTSYRDLFTLCLINIALEMGEMVEERFWDFPAKCI